MDLDLWDCFGRKTLCLITEKIRYYTIVILLQFTNGLFQNVFVLRKCKSHRFNINLPLSLCRFEPRSEYMLDAKFCTGRSGGFSQGTLVFAHL